MKSKTYVNELLPTRGFGFGTLGEKMEYVVTGAREAFLFVTDYNQKENPRIRVAPKEFIDELAVQKVEIRKCLDSDQFKPIEDIGETVAAAEVGNLLIEPQERDDKKENENSVQTQDEAEIANNKVLIEQVQKMFTDEPEVPPMEKLVDYRDIPDPPNGRKPLVYTVYGFPHGRLFPTETFIFLYSEKLVIVSTLKGGSYEEFKSFMYEDVKKSSKMSFGLGLGLSNAASSSGKKKATGPEEGKPVYKDGKPLTNADGFSIGFNFEWTKKWARLAIKAEMRRIGKVEGYNITKCKI
ncbi:MAG: hypothetical protein PVH61_29910 [Candidatus Aminicenantes bacterium]|jgi:hypothetical protein